MIQIYLSIGLVVLIILGSLGGALHYYKSEYRRLEKEFVQTEYQLNLTERILETQSKAIEETSSKLNTYSSKLKELEKSTESKNIDSANVRTCEDLKLFLDRLSEKE